MGPGAARLRAYAVAMIITVVGEQRAARAPERATLSLRLAFEAGDPGTAMEALTHAAAQFSAELEELKHASPSPTTWSAVQAPGTRTWRPWSEKGTVLPLRHEASVRASVKFRDFPALSVWVSRWGQRPGWHVDGVVWSLTEQVRAELEASALAGAVGDARRRAGIIAVASGAGAVRFLEVADPGLLPNTEGHASLEGGAVARAFAKDAQEGVAVSPEDVEVSVRLHARFEA